MQGAFSDRPNLKNIDLIRFLAAFIVVCSHIGRVYPIVKIHDFGAVTRSCAFHSALQFFFNGGAAVMLFFVVSGICINLPYVHNRPVNIAEFYVRRYLRIGPPLLVAYILSILVSGLYDCSALAVVWTLWCEAIYYLLYPLIVYGVSRIGFRWIFALSCLASLLLSLTPDQNHNHAWNYGPLLTWIIFLPVWLSGFWISENREYARKIPSFLKSGPVAAAGGMGIFLLSLLWTVLRFHAHGVLGYPLYTMLCFAGAGAVFIFLLMEIDLSHNRFLSFLDRQGKWSYSLYLVHYPTLFLTTYAMIRLFGIEALNQKFYIVSCFIVLALACFFATLFYALVEAPSHRLAKALGIKVGRLSNLIIRPSVVPLDLKLARSEAIAVTDTTR